MANPFFYSESATAAAVQFELDTDTSRHVVQVLRMKEGEGINLTDGKGGIFHTTIALADKKRCIVQFQEATFTPATSPRIVLAISVLKNSNRIEWLLEKITEIGVSEIIPLLCDRTEKEKFRADRMRSICISAMLQSQQSWLPVLHEPIAFDLLFRQEEIAGIPGKFIAHCDEGERINFNDALMRAKGADKILLIGPEGDFSPRETALATGLGYIPVSLGETRLRTETAGLVGVVMMKNF